MKHHHQIVEEEGEHGRLHIAPDLPFCLRFFEHFCIKICGSLLYHLSDAFHPRLGAPDRYLMIEPEVFRMEPRRLLVAADQIRDHLHEGNVLFPDLFKDLIQISQAFLHTRGEKRFLVFVVFVNDAHANSGALCDPAYARARKALFGKSVRGLIDQLSHLIFSKRSEHQSSSLSVLYFLR